MTNPGVVIARRVVNGKLTDILDREATEQRRRRGIISESELAETLERADKIENPYFRLRAKALLALGKIFWKRRLELSLLEMADMKVEGEFLYLTFTVVKKHKKGLHQYLKHLERQGNPELLDKPLPELQSEWREWAKTEPEYRIKKTRKQKATLLSDKYARMVLEYFEFMQTRYPESKYLFPSGKDVFGNYMILPDKPLSERMILYIVAELNPDLWVHLLRRSKGSEVASRYGRTIESVFQVKETLDLERIETSYAYIEEFVSKVETGETDAFPKKGKG